MCLARTGPTNSGTGCCGSPNDSVINGLAGWEGASSSGTRKKGERSLASFPPPWGARDDAVMAILVAPAFVQAADRLRPVGYGSNHHRYGEVKTRLTIGVSAEFGLGLDRLV